MLCSVVVLLLLLFNLQQGGGNAMLCATVEPPVRLSYDTSSVALKWQMCAISGHMCLSRLPCYVELSNQLYEPEF